MVHLKLALYEYYSTPLHSPFFSLFLFIADEEEFHLLKMLVVIYVNFVCGAVLSIWNCKI